MQIAPQRHKGEMGGIESIEDLDRIIKLIGLSDLAIQQVADRMNVEIAKLKTAAVAEATPLKNERDALLALAATYVKANRDELIPAPKKSRTLNHGKFGFRKIKDELELPKKGSPEMEDIVKRIEALAAIQADPFGQIPIYKESWILKTGLNGVSNEYLKTLGLERKAGEDDFFVEPDKTKIEVPDEPRAAIGG